MVAELGWLPLGLFRINAAADSGVPNYVYTNPPEYLPVGNIAATDMFGHTKARVIRCGAIKSHQNRGQYQQSSPYFSKTHTRYCFGFGVSDAFTFFFQKPMVRIPVLMPISCLFWAPCSDRQANGRACYARV
jgi:hypothetical protein